MYRWIRRKTDWVPPLRFVSWLTSSCNRRTSLLLPDELTGPLSPPDEPFSAVEAVAEAAPWVKAAVVPTAGVYPSPVPFEWISNRFMSVSKLSRMIKVWRLRQEREREGGGVEPNWQFYLPWVYVKPRKGRWRALNTELAVGGRTSALRRSVSSTSKFDVSVGLLTSGMYGAVLSRMLSQSMPENQGWF